MEDPYRREQVERVETPVQLMLEQVERIRQYSVSLNETNCRGARSELFPPDSAALFDCL